MQLPKRVTQPSLLGQVDLQMIFQVVENAAAVISVNTVNAIATYMGMVKSLLKKEVR